MPAKKQPKCQAKSTTTGKRCQRASTYSANRKTVLLCGTHARNYADKVRL